MFRLGCASCCGLELCEPNIINLYPFDSSSRMILPRPKGWTLNPPPKKWLC
jgi:hypothetical protein